MDDAADQRDDPRHDCSFRGLSLRSILPEQFLPLTALTSLDISHNELTDISGLEKLQSLTTLDISRNWFKHLPAQVAELCHLEDLNASRNFLRPSTLRPALEQLKAKLTSLRVLDLRFNRKCDRQDLLDTINNLFPGAEARLSITRDRNGHLLPLPEGSFVGGSPAERDATLLRSQLEPWPTNTLRDRLVDEFGEAPTDPDTVNRAEIMARLLDCYAREDPNGRRTIRVDGESVSAEVCKEVLVALREWAAQHTTGNQVRTSIQASCYMILRKEATGKYQGSEEYKRIWALAEKTISEVRPKTQENPNFQNPKNHFVFRVQGLYAAFARRSMSSS
eukprot:1187256-Prorocentrum_minimum.AAC.1